jgi:hypothetical protein
MNQLFELSRKFPDSLVKQKPGKFAAAYVDHGTINARLLEVVGPFDFRIDRIITNSEGVAVGCTGELTVQVDGEKVTIVEVGDVEQVSANSATNLKSASSDCVQALLHEARAWPTPLDGRLVLSGQVVGEASG